MLQGYVNPRTTDQKVGGRTRRVRRVPSGRATGILRAGGCRMDGRRAGVPTCLGGGASILVLDLGGCESLPVDLEQVVDGADESPLT